MAKEQPKLEHPIYLEASTSNADDRRKLIGRIPLLEAFLRDLGFTEQKAFALLQKQRAEVYASNTRLITQRNKQKQKILELQRKEIADIFFNHFDFEYLDDNGVWLPCKADETILYEHKNVDGETEYKIETTPRKLVEASLLNAITELKGDATQLKEQMHRIYNNYILRQWYPPLPDTEIRKSRHFFELRLKWRL